MIYINKKNKLVLHASMGEPHRHKWRERGHQREYMPHDSAYTKLNVYGIKTVVPKRVGD